MPRNEGKPTIACSAGASLARASNRRLGTASYMLRGNGTRLGEGPFPSFPRLTKLKMAAKFREVSNLAAH